MYDASLSVAHTCGQVDNSEKRIRRIQCTAWLRGKTVRVTSRPDVGLSICEMDFYGMRL